MLDVKRAGLPALVAGLCLGVSPLAWGQSEPSPEQTTTPPSPASPPPEDWAVHGQATFTEQYHPAFRSLIRGPNSLDPGSRGDETFDATLYLGVRPWGGAELWIDPEIDQGFGVSNTLGIANFPSAEAYKVGSAEPYVRVPRVFLRQTIDLGGEALVTAPDQDVLGGRTTSNRLVLTIGKFGVPDVFDQNSFAHDPRQDFMAWALVDTGTFDYAADAWGYSYGVTAEWYQDWWTLRGGAFALSRVPNSKELDTSGGQVQFIAEAEARYAIFGRDGVARINAFDTRGRMGDYSDAIVYGRSHDAPVDIAAVRQYRSRTGLGLDIEQRITATLGAFLRAGIAEGGREPYEFTDIDKVASLGLSLAGAAWGRPDDTVGLAGTIADLSRRGKNFLSAGGLGILVGDGALPQSGPEQSVETYYSFAVRSWAHVTADYQFVNNPAYDRLRGPVSLLGVRLHVQY